MEIKDHPFGDDVEFLVFKEENLEFLKNTKKLKISLDFEYKRAPVTKYDQIIDNQIAICGTHKSGKTTLNDLILLTQGYNYDCRVSPKFTDETLQEIQREISLVPTSYTATFTQNYLITDMPGHPSFTGQNSCGNLCIVHDISSGFIFSFEKILNEISSENFLIVFTGIDKLIMSLKLTNAEIKNLIFYYFSKILNFFPNFSPKKISISAPKFRLFVSLKAYADSIGISTDALFFSNVTRVNGRSVFGEKGISAFENVLISSIRKTFALVALKDNQSKIHELTGKVSLNCQEIFPLFENFSKFFEILDKNLNTSKLYSKRALNSLDEKTLIIAEKNFTKNEFFEGKKILKILSATVRHEIELDSLSKGTAGFLVLDSHSTNNDEVLYPIGVPISTINGNDQSLIPHLERICREYPKMSFGIDALPGFILSSTSEISLDIALHDLRKIYFRDEIQVGPLICQEEDLIVEIVIFSGDEKKVTELLNKLGIEQTPYFRLPGTILSNLTLSLPAKILPGIFSHLRNRVKKINLITH